MTAGFVHLLPQYYWKCWNSEFYIDLLFWEVLYFQFYQRYPVRNLSEEKREIAAYVSKALSFVRKMQKFLATPQVPPTLCKLLHNVGYVSDFIM